MESNGRQAALITDKATGEAMGVAFSARTCEMMDETMERTDGVFFTLTELATRDAAMIKAAEARGAAGMRGRCATFVDMCMDTDGGVDGQQILNLTSVGLEAHDADTRNTALDAAYQVTGAEECDCDFCEVCAAGKRILALKTKEPT